MSNTKKILRDISTSTEYQALTEAIEKTDYGAMFDSYMSISEVIDKSRGQIEEGIEGLAVRSKDERLEDFRQSFDSAVERMLPHWYQLYHALERMRVMDGEVFSIGKKGDPLVKTPEGIIVALRSAKLDVGDRVKFIVEHEREKICIGRVFDLNPQSFYTVITQEHRDKIRNCFNSIDDYLRSGPEVPEEDSLARLGELLVELEGIKKFPDTYRLEERRRVTTQALKYKKRLLYEVGITSMLDFISLQEEKAIEDFFADNQEEKEKALSALGLFRRYTYGAAEKLLQGDKSEKKVGDLIDIDDEIDSMDSVMKVLEYKDSIDKAFPRAKSYLKKMNRLFDNLRERAGHVTDSLSEAGTVDLEEIRQAVENAFTEDKLFLELRKAFHTSKEFLSFRSAYTELIKAQRDEESIAAENAFRSYLQYKIPQALGSQKS